MANFNYSDKYLPFIPILDSSNLYNLTIKTLQEGIKANLKVGQAMSL